MGVVKTRFLTQIQKKISVIKFTTFLYLFFNHALIMFFFIKVLNPKFFNHLYHFKKLVRTTYMEKLVANGHRHKYERDFTNIFKLINKSATIW